MGLVKCARSDCCFCRAKSPPSRRCSPTPLPHETPCGAHSQQGLGVLGGTQQGLCWSEEEERWGGVGAGETLLRNSACIWEVMVETAQEAS